MKIKSTQNSFPAKIDFDYLERIDIDYYPAKILYRSFFAFLNFPRTIIYSLSHILTSPIDKQHNKKTTILEVEKKFFKIFDEMYSLDSKRIFIKTKRRNSTGLTFN